MYALDMNDYALVPPANAQLETIGDFASEATRKARFARSFRAAWGRLPQDVQAVLVERWQASPSGALNVIFCDAKLTGGPSRDACGQCRRGGLEIAFHAPVVGRLPSHDVQKVVAHELGHAYLLLTDPRHGLVPEADEEEVDKLLKRWDIETLEPEKERSRNALAGLGVDLSSQ